MTTDEHYTNTSGKEYNPQDYKSRNKFIAGLFLKVLIVITLLTVILHFLLYRDKNYRNYVNPDTKQKIDSLAGVIHNQQSNIENYKSEIATLQSYALQLEAETQANKEKINKIKKEYEKKHAAVDNYDTNSLDSFFTNRYR
jgi:peptidoglycan hydrolase CwlO-like protein